MSIYRGHIQPLGATQKLIDKYLFPHSSQYSHVHKMLDVVREVITFWKQNKAHIWIRNTKQGFFGIVGLTDKEMAEFASRR